MKTYAGPDTKTMTLQHFAFAQIASGETLFSLECSGGVEQCDASLGVTCACNNFLEIEFLAPGVSCSDIHDGADCSISPSCNNQQFSAEQCDAGCLVHVSCTAQCDGLDFTASCPGFEDCSANAGATGC